AEGAGKAYRYLQALYGMPAAILASGPRADGLRRFLEQELGMEVVCFARREELSDQEDFYRELRGSESALLFGSSFEQDGADELEIPLIRMDYPVFDEVCLTPRPHLGGQGTLHLLEDIFRGIMNGRTLKGALYQ
ncbi:nitrogenase component 1, partial [Flavonifractor plautii]|nr:oxidoreductase [Flavonifractor plautii]